MRDTQRKAKITPEHAEEARKLKAIFEERAGMSQAAFAAKHELGTQGNLWQYLNARSPLNVAAAVKFAHALGVNISDFSDRLAAEHAALSTAAPTATEYAQATAKADLSVREEPASYTVERPWPLPAVPEETIRALTPEDRARVEGAIFVALGQLGIDVKAPPPTPAVSPVADLPFPLKPMIAPAAAVPPRLAAEADLPFPESERTRMPWEGGASLPPAMRPLISTERDVVANVSAGDHAANEEFEPVPELADVRLAAGEEGIEVLNEAAAGVMHFRRSFLRKHAADNGRARVVYADGDSMEPVIPDGAALLLVPASGLSLRDVANSGVWAINYGGKMLVKTITRPRGGMWVARSYNADYPDILLETDVEVRIIGQIVWIGSELPSRNGAQWVRR